VRVCMHMCVLRGGHVHMPHIFLVSMWMTGEKSLDVPLHTDFMIEEMSVTVDFRSNVCN
jgi:hypothetical protein